jgi:hypothetical protein
MGLVNVRANVGLFLGDLELLREGVSLLSEFGLRSTERLAYVAAFLERSVYARKSLRAVPNGVGFTLMNPPLRVGAFSSVRVAWDGVFRPLEQTFVRVQGHAVERSLADIILACPIELRPGQPIDFHLEGIPTDTDAHRVRIELQNIAVPPLVWFEFTDTISEPVHS